VGSSFLEGAYSFLHCQVGKMPFIYLGVPWWRRLRKIAILTISYFFGNIYVSFV
jgi:hypothetical protein